MEILDTQRKVQTVLEVTGRELGWQVYRTSHTVHPAEMEAGKEAEAGEKGTGGWSELPSGLILQGYLKEKIQTAGGNKVSNIQCGASRVSEDGEWIDHVTLTSRSRKRGWIGAEGGYFSEKNGSEPEGKWVYVGRDSMRYHLSPSCHYISNQITAAAYADVISGVLRNSGGWCIFFRPARFPMESRTVRHWHIMCRRCGDQRWNIWVCVHTVEVDRCGWRKESRRGERAE